jgi:hypothetical protein
VTATKLGVYIDSPSLAGYQAFNAKIAPRKIDQMLFLSNMNVDPAIGTNWATWAATLGASICNTLYPNTTTLGAFAAGTYDTTGLNANAGLVGLAAACASYGKPMIIRLAHEFNGNWCPSYGQAFETAAQFVAGWQHVVTLFRTQGALNVRWCWNPNVWGKPFDNAIDPTVADGSGVNWYPGDAYVDIVALDSYVDTEDGTLYTPLQRIQPCYATLSGLYAKPFAMGEFGVTKDSRLQAFCGGKNGYYDLLFSLFGTMANLEFIQQWEQPGNAQTPTDDWTISSSGSEPVAAAAFVRGVSAPPLTVGTKGLFRL